MCAQVITECLGVTFVTVLATEVKTLRNDLRFPALVIHAMNARPNFLALLTDLGDNK